MFPATSIINQQLHLHKKKHLKTIKIILIVFMWNFMLSVIVG